MNSYNELSLFKEDALSIAKKWEHWDISTLSFLSIINNFASRSFKDLTQYPIFPWVIKDYESKKLNAFNESNIRDLNKPIGALGSELRLECFMQNYKESKELEMETRAKKEKLLIRIKEKKEEKDKNNLEENDNNSLLVEEKRYFYSSHYSNPFYVVHYMSKVFPYSFCAIELQGDGFDKRERQFLSMINSWNNCMNENTDIRELIPEFFYLPEMFRNVNKLNMGKLESGEEVNNVKTPCNDNPYDFIMTMKNVLESNKISYTIQNWVDLIFGYKARGKDAESAKNLFTEASYQMY
jgi:hypothetical protein